MSAQSWYRVSYEPTRGQPRTAPEVVCGACFDALHQPGGPWAVESEHLTDPRDWPELCPICHVGRRTA